MKRFAAIMLASAMTLALIGCGGKTQESSAPAEEAVEEAAEETEEVTEETEATEEAALDVPVMTHEEYMAAEMDTPVCVETYVQATQSWWDNKITVYAQSEDGAYFLYNMTCAEEDAAKLVPGQKIKVTGYKTSWSGEIEIIDATFELEDGNWVAEPTDATAMLGTDELEAHQNERVLFTDMTVEAKGENGDAFLYAWDGSGSADTDSDLYFDVSKDGQTYTFTVEYYLAGPGSDAYEAVRNLKVGDVIDIEGFMYWYEGPQTHVTGVTVK